MVQCVLHPQVNDNIYPAHDREKKAERNQGNSVLLQFRACSASIWSKYCFHWPDAGCIGLLDPGKASHYSDQPQNSLLCQAGQKKLVCNIKYEPTTLSCVKENTQLCIQGSLNVILSDP